MTFYLFINKTDPHYKIYKEDEKIHKKTYKCKSDKTAKYHEDVVNNIENANTNANYTQGTFCCVLYNCPAYCHSFY